MDDLKSKLGGFAAKLTKSISDGVSSITETPSSDGSTPEHSSVLENEEQSQSPQAIKKALQTAASLNFKLQRKFTSVAIKFIAKHPPPLTVDLYFESETISRILKRCEKSHCYSAVQLAWLDSLDYTTELRVPVPESETLLQEINQVSALLRTEDLKGAEELALHLQETNPELRHPVISNCCFEASMNSQDTEVQLECALKQLECRPFDGNAALIINQSTDPESLRGQVCRLVLNAKGSW